MDGQQPPAGRAPSHRQIPRSPPAHHRRNAHQRRIRRQRTSHRQEDPRRQTRRRQKFVEYVTTNDEGIDARVSNGSFPATTKTLNQKDFLTRTTLKNTDGSDNEFFGGQKYNEIFSQAAKDVTGKWEFLPFEPYARSIYGDSMGSFFEGKTSFRTAADNWQKALKDYAKDQGFTVQ